MFVRSRFLSRLLGAAVLLAAAGCGAREAAHEPGRSRAPERGRVSVTEAAPDTGSDPMIVALEDAFTARNPDASRVSILEFRREGGGGGANLVLARGAGSGSDASDELFGVFVFDDSLRRVLRTVTMFPAPQRNGTLMRIERTTPDSVFLLGWAKSDGETLMTAGFRWRAAGAP